MKNLVAACLFVLSGVGVTSGQEPQFSELIVFGDSLSDAGNLGVHEPPYYNGRFSNGPSWIDRLADRFGIERPEASKFGGANYAWAAATTRDELQYFGDFYIPGLDAQVSEYLAEGSPQVGQLFSVWIGTNDFWARFENDPELSANWAATGMDRLLDAGVQDLLVLNLSVHHGEIDESLPRYNSMLAEQLNHLRNEYPSATIYEFDYASFLDAVVADPASFDLTEPLAPACADCSLGEIAGVDIAEDPDAFYFWDDIHISAKGNQLIGDEVYRQFFSLPGDLNLDGAVDVEDIDLLSVETALKNPRPGFDINGDGLVNEADRVTWVESLAGSFFGDADLNGKVDFADFLALADAFGQDGGWSQGDFDGSRDIAFPDFLLLSNNFGNEALSPVAAVPEPCVDHQNWVTDSSYANTLVGDSNLDGKVDFPDFVALSSRFGQDGGWAQGDFDGNGVVEFPDFLGLATNYGNQAAASVVAVPEPSGSLLAAFAILGLIGLRRRG